MAGTSLDGVDLAFCNFTVNNNDWEYKITANKTYVYNQEILTIIEKVIENPILYNIPFNNALGSFYAILINSFIKEFDIERKDIFCIASHGQTVLHNPAKKITIQAGAAYQIAAATEITTVADFRTLDIAFGGQGAPLVPIGDLHLFKGFKVCINLGGICNISIKENNEIVSAFDICVCNVVLNYFAAMLGKKYDENGAIAKTGKVNLDLLLDFDKMEYFKIKGPKSLDAKQILELYKQSISKSKLPITDVLRTLVEHIAIHINNVLRNNNVAMSAKILVTGGGAFNQFLMERLHEIEGYLFEIPDQKIIEFKEALIFAFMGLLRIKNQINVLNKVTGASKSTCSGTVYKV